METSRDRTALGMKFVRTHYQYLERIDGAIAAVLKPYSDHPLFSPLSYSLKGGKRLRPLVCLLVNEALGSGAQSPDRAAVAIELLHTVSLIHDDFIDRPLLRRDAPPYYKEFGEESAFLVADFVLGLTLSIASSYNGRQVGEELSKTAVEMSHGEERERLLFMSGARVPTKEYLTVIELKTASLFRAAAYIGSALSSRPDLSDSFARFGHRVGLAYQLRDDLADMGQDGELTSLLEVEGVMERRAFLESEAQRNVELALKEVAGIGESEPLGKLKRLLTDYF